MVYSNDFRLMAIKLYFHYKESKCDTIYNLIHLLNISKSILYTWISLYDSSNNCFSKGFKIDRQCRTNKITDIIVKYICEYVTKRQNFNVKTLRQYIKRKFNVHISKSYVYHILKSNNLTLKRVQKQTIPNNISYKDKQKQLYKKITEVIEKNIISVDESHIVIGQQSNYAWSLKGKH